jgi:hypothetical protein
MMRRSDWPAAWAGGIPKAEEKGALTRRMSWGVSAETSAKGRALAARMSGRVMASEGEREMRQARGVPWASGCEEKRAIRDCGCPFRE